MVKLRAGFTFSHDMTCCVGRTSVENNQLENRRPESVLFALLKPKCAARFLQSSRHPRKEREKSAWPYRVLARPMADSDDEEDDEEDKRFVVLKREPSHFVLLKTAPSPDERSAPGAGTGGGGAATTTKQRGGGRACFSRSDLPDVVKRLWQIESKTKSPASREVGGCGRRA